MLLEASQALNLVIAKCGDDKSIPWKTIITLIEVYNMTEKLQKTWAGKVLSSEELKQYADFEHKLKTSYSESDKHDFEKNWAKLVEKVSKNLQQDPTGDIGIEIAKQVMDLINPVYGREHASLRKVVWEKGFEGGYFDKETGMTSEIVAWLDKAMDSYYRGRIYSILDQIGTSSEGSIFKLWEDLLSEMYGDDQHFKDELVAVAMQDGKVHSEAKNWLKHRYKL